MIFNKEGTTTIVSQEETTVSTFLKTFKKSYPQLKHNAVIVNLSSFGAITTEDLLAFLEISNTHRTLGQSFVLVSSAVSYDEIPQELALVPTLQEAKDLIAMEDMERDLYNS